MSQEQREARLDDPEPDAVTPREFDWLPWAVVLALTAGVASVFRPENAGGLGFYGGLAGLFGAGALLSVHWLSRRGQLRALCTPKSGDLTLGALVGLLLIVATWVGRTSWADDVGRQAWLWLVYLQIGDPAVLQRSFLFTGLIFGTVVAEELVFHGLLQTHFTERWGERRGWIVTALCYALVLSPTLFTLRAPGVGMNPLLFLAALLVGLTTSFLRKLTGRLPPALVAHLVFSYFSATQFRPPGL